MPTQGSNWILLRGLVRGTEHWGSFKDRLQKRFPNDTLEYLDLPGNGRRCAEESPLKISEYVTDLRAHSELVKKGEKFKILSMSLGAMVTVEWMRQFPEEVTQAFLMCTSSSGFSPFYHRFLLNNYLRIPRLLAAQNDVEFVEKSILEMTTNNFQRQQAELSSFVEYSKSFRLKPQNAIRQLLAASRYRFPKQAPGSVCLIGSYGDRLVSPQCTLEIGKAWGLVPQMHPWGGHDLAIDDPEWVLEQLF